MRVSIQAIPCLRDNYAYLLRCESEAVGYLVDPSEPAAPREALAAHGLKLGGILCTHHHWDHVGGIEVLCDEHPSAWVAGSAHDRGRIPRQNVFVEAPEGRFAATSVTMFGRIAQASLIPGHTLGALAWALPDATGQLCDVFTGDTLFGAGCGRLFEGSPAQMFASLQALCRLPDPTRLWFGHEFTRGILEWRLRHVPDDTACKTYLSELAEVTTPSTVAREWQINAFVRAPDVEAFTALRKLKDLG